VPPEDARRWRFAREELSRAAAAAGRSPDAVRLVAVTKTVGAERIRALHSVGLTLVGENRLQEAQAKQSLLSDLPLEWHLVGHLQTNKVRHAVGRFALIHSVDSVRLLEALDAAARNKGLVQDLLLQVNVSGEATKSGFRPADVPEALRVAQALSGVRVRGLMTIAPWGAGPAEAGRVFQSLAGLLAEGRRQPGGEALTELSMGMTDDFRTAVAHGATLVRIGTGLFGSRPASPGFELGTSEEAR
jgi:hypothetical protein